MKTIAITSWRLLMTLVAMVAVTPHDDEDNDAKLWTRTN